jgi:hypothetical protein
MARSHGKLKCSIWQDPEFVALPPRCQWAFMLILSQPKLSLVGCLDYMPRRWAKLAEGMTVDALEAAVERLEDAGFVCVDRDTDELLVRSFTRHDGINAGNSKLLKGVWGAWTAVESARLRKVAVDNMPAELFRGDVPDEAQRFRRSERMDWVTDRTIEPGTEQATDTTTLLPPSSTHLPPSTVTGSVEQSITVPGSGTLSYFQAEPQAREEVDDRIFDELRGVHPLLARKGGAA